MVNRQIRPVNRKRAGDPRARTAAGVLAQAAARLRRSGVDSPEPDARLLLAQALGITRARLLAELSQPVPTAKQRVFRRLLERRSRREPLQYLLGHEAFAELDLRVGPGVLIPRPETELLLAEALRRCQPQAGDWLADLGTGSGNLALALARRFTRAQVVGVDISPAALRWARLNRRRLGAPNLRLLRGQAPEAIPQKLRGGFALVVANPPYIPTGQLAGLQAEVRFEPRRALDGGPDGLAGVRLAARAAARLLKPGGVLAVEIGIGQARAAKNILCAAGFSSLEALPDWQGIPRIVSGLFVPSPDRPNLGKTPPARNAR